MSRWSLSISLSSARARVSLSTAPPVSRLVGQRLELLVLVVELGQLLVVQVVQLLRRFLAGRRGAGDGVDVDERDLRVRGERHRRLLGAGAAGRGGGAAGGVARRLGGAPRGGVCANDGSGQRQRQRRRDESEIFKTLIE